MSSPKESPGNFVEEGVNVGFSDAMVSICQVVTLTPDGTEQEVSAVTARFDAEGSELTVEYTTPEGVRLAVLGPGESWPVHLYDIEVSHLASRDQR